MRVHRIVRALAVDGLDVATARQLKFQGLCIGPVITTPAASRQARFGLSEREWELSIQPDTSTSRRTETRCHPTFQ
jgi:hypothetical protein